MRKIYKHMTAVLTAMLVVTGHPLAQELAPDTLRNNEIVRYKNADPENPPPPSGIFSRNLLTPSPDGCALMRSINVPVEKYTGVANIQVPITEIKVGEEKSIPVSLSYHASGVKVADLASVVGLGWRLSAGGRISRTVRGWPDDLANFSNRTEMQDDAMWTKEKFDSLKLAKYDTQPDLFYFEYPGGGGMFVFDDSGIPRTIPGQNIDIQYSLGQFTITDIDGNEYLYSSTESSSYSVPDNPPNEPYISSWFLNHIRYNDGSLVVLNYIETPGYIYYNRSTEVRVDYAATVYNTGKVDERISTPYYGISRDASINIRYPKYLSSIRYKDNIIEFSYDNQRSDVVGLRRLNQITVSYGDKPTKIYGLNYGQFPNKNLKLLNVEDLSISSSPLKICSFEYYEDKNLPSRRSFVKDHWGYYNNDLESDIYQPETDIVSRNTGQIFHIDGNSKNPSLPHTRANTIRRIKYPTGGVKEFEYELHSYTDPATGRFRSAGGLRIKKIIDRSSERETPSVYTYSYSGGVPYVDTVNYCASVSNETSVYPDGSRYENITYYLSSDPVNDIIDMNNCSVIYSSVKEQLSNGAYNVYHYVPYGDMPDQEAALHKISRNGQFVSLGPEKSRMSSKTSKHYRRNLIQKQISYSAEGSMVQSTDYAYSYLNEPCIIHAINYYLEGYLQHGSTGPERFSDPIRYIAKYCLESQPIHLSKITIQKGLYNLASTTEIEYDTMTQLPMEIVKTDCERNRFRTTITYPGNYPQASLNAADRYTRGLAAMQQAKIRSAPVETVTWRNGRVVDASLNLYSVQNLRPVLTTTRKFLCDPVTALTTFPASAIDAGGNFVMDDRYETIQEIDYFDLDNTPLTTTGKGHTRASVIYGYRNTLPLAVVQGAAHSITDIVEGEEEVVLKNNPSENFVLQRPQTTDFTLFMGPDQPVDEELEIIVRRKIPKIDTLLRYFITPVAGEARFSADLPAGSYSLYYRWTNWEIDDRIPNVETRYREKLYLTLANGYNNRVFHTSFEEEGLEQPLYETKFVLFPQAKSGEWVCQAPYTIDFKDFDRGTYELTYWVYDKAETEPRWESVTTTIRRRAGTVTYTIPASSNLYIDEVRVMPAGTPMTTFAYKPTIGKLTQTDPTGVSEHYAYDAAGRLISITDSEGQLVQRYTYSGYNKVIEETINGNADLQKNITYLDGLGRREQTIHAGVSPDRKKDLVHFWSYDEMGRDDAVSYLPYAVSDGGGLRRSDPYGEQISYYNDLLGTSMIHQPYIYKFYDSTPQGKVLKTRGPRDASTDESQIEPRSGEPAATKAALYETVNTYGFNTEADRVRRYVLVQDSVVKWQDYYAADQLRMQQSRTPRTSLDDASLVREFYDSENRKVMEEAYLSDTEYERTYYVYDDFGRLRYTLPSPANGYFNRTGATRSPWQLRKYCYYTVYDRYGRAERMLNAGAGWVYKLYDLRDRETMSQTAEMRKENKWLVTLYDNLNRPIRTGEYTGGDFETHREALETTLFNYPDLQPEDELTRIYYDDYDWLGQTEKPFYTYTYDQRINIDGTPVTREVQTRKREYVRGLETGRSVKVLGTDQWLSTTNFYDEYGRVAQTVSDLYPAGTERVINHRNANGNITYIYVNQFIPGTISYPVGYGKEMAYDHRDRLTSVKFLTFRDRGTKIRPPEGYMPGYDEINGKVTVAAYTYDDLGRVKTKSIHNGAETTTFGYDLAGQQLSARSPSFSYTLGYDFPTLEAAQPRYDGLLAEAVWKRRTQTPSGYTYAYNLAGYMTEGLFTRLQDTTWQQTDLYSETVGYGPCGRIDRIRRTPANGVQTLIEEQYDGFQMRGADIDSVRYGFVYDSDGRLLFDGKQHVQLQYNILGLPEKIFDGSHEIRYIYDAGGRKLAMALRSSYTYYRNTLVYEGGGDIPAQILHPEGFVSTGQTSGFIYHYHKKDHAGNVRALLTASGTTLTQQQTTDYFPFGLAHSYDDLDKNRWLYSGKELQDGTVGTDGMLGWYDYGARMYNPLFGHWFAPDPAYQALNPYLFCGNAPMCYVDENGEFFISFLFGMIRGWIKGENVFKAGWDSFKSTAKIVGGLFTGDFLQILSRFTWELPQTLLGFVGSFVGSELGFVHNVDYYDGATVVNSDILAKKAITFGSFILGGYLLEANPDNSVFQHEYGHYFQSQKFGPIFLTKVGVPSLISATLSSEHEYDRWEINANQLSISYFEKKFPGMVQDIRFDEINWNETQHPLWIQPLNMDQRNVPVFNSARLTEQRKIGLRTENEKYTKPKRQIFITY